MFLLRTYACHPGGGLRKAEIPFQTKQKAAAKQNSKLKKSSFGRRLAASAEQRFQSRGNACSELLTDPVARSGRAVTCGSQRPLESESEEDLCTTNCPLSVLRPGFAEQRAEHHMGYVRRLCTKETFVCNLNWTNQLTGRSLSHPCLRTYVRILTFATGCV